MNKMPETVTNKFIELFAVLHNATDDLKMAGAEAYLIGDFSKVDVITDSCRKLQALEAEIKTSMNNFDAKYIIQPAAKPNFYKKDKHRTRKPGDRLIVKVAGKIIEESTMAETFVKTLRVFGLERVAKLNKTLASIPLMAKSPVNGYQAQRRCDGWYITTHVNKASATTVLEEIAKELHIPVKVEFIER
jgi:hypothetical protein